jgi:hypothetical protein
MYNPYLIQRCKINRPLGEYVGLPVSKAVRFDYMGSAEFEFGAIPKSFREIRANFDQYKITRVPSVTETKDVAVALRVFHNMSDGEFAEYTKWLESARANESNIDTKESVGLDPKGHYNKDVDFWWDIDNNVMFSFDKNFMNRLTEHLQASFAIMKD